MTPEQENLVSPSVMFALVRDETRLQEAKKEAAAKLKAANGDIKAHHGKVKSFGIKIKNFEDVYAQMMADDAGDEWMQDMREKKRMMELLKLPIGHQFSILDEFDAVDKAKEDDPEASHYFKGGVRAYLRGDKEDECPHSLNAPEGQDWLRGYRWAEGAAKEGADVMAATSADDTNDDAKASEADAPPKKKRRGRPPKNKSNGAGEGATA